VSVTLAIAWNTVLEAVREKVLYLLGGFAGFTFVASRVLSPLALGEGRRVTIDIGMAALSLFGLLIIIFVGHSLVYREMERGTVAFLFSRPVGRGSFVAGKYLGLCAVLAAAVAAMGAVLALVLLASGYAFGLELGGAVLLTLLELWILAAVAILFAALSSPALAGFFVLGAWVIGNTAGSLVELAALLPAGGMRSVARGFLWVLPRLDLYDGSAWLVHGRSIPPEQWAWSLAYALLYSLAALCLARAAFARRSLVW
jgi:ABC-type transport system involved in multi-copper enzyme maturation permease subunit